MHDYTDELRAYIQSGREDEAKAEIAGWNALLSRERTNLPGADGPTMMLDTPNKRVDDFMALQLPGGPPDLIGRYAMQVSKVKASKARWLALVCVLVMTACATASESPQSAKETTTMHPVASAQNPTLSAEEIGKRFLKLIEGLNSRSDLSLDLVRETLGLEFSTVPGDKTHYVSESPLGSNWSYVVGFLEETKSNKKSVYLDFTNATARFADMMQVCSLDFEYYHKALKNMGFSDSPSYGEIGQLEDWRYTKFKKIDGTVDMTLLVIPQNVVAGESGRLCIKSIRMLNDR
ncbi:hypothetical protein [Xanthomonas campestris]|uniref:hypothetical protein n=1 Tax=Xanthomonas campestris TaxID=339 RepID=UPI001E30E402|nr:hypothetical protein [Xanthomonas campestris]MCC4604418.1 hypothetical protein [Xanthomonas campestris pv. parthenii]